MKFNFNYYDRNNYRNTILDQLEINDEQLAELIKTNIKDTFNNDQKFFEHDSIYTLAEIINCYAVVDGFMNMAITNFAREDIAVTFNFAHELEDAIKFIKASFKNNDTIHHIASHCQINIQDSYETTIFMPHDRKHLNLENIDINKIEYKDVYALLRYIQLFNQNKLFFGRQIAQLQSLEIVY